MMEFTAIPLFNFCCHGVVSWCDMREICLEHMRFHFGWALGNARCVEAKTYYVRTAAGFWNGLSSSFFSYGHSAADNAARDI
jgi:hypothetical protein